MVPSFANSILNDFGLSFERLDFILAQVRKKLVAPTTMSGIHFTVYAPTEFVAMPEWESSTSIYDALKDTVWRIKWYDDERVELRFIEFLIFIHQVLAMLGAQRRVRQQSTIRQYNAVNSKRSVRGQLREQSTQRSEILQENTAFVKLDTTISLPEITTDKTIRLLLSHVAIEKGSPNDAPR